MTLKPSLKASLAVIAVFMLSVSNVRTEDSDWNTNQWAPMKTDSMLSRRSADNAAEQQQVQGRNYAVHEQSAIYSNETDINTVIDQIINSRREGRILNEFDQVYADGNVEQALQQGNDMQARNLIRDKLCGLGLMSCDVEEKRPFYSTIYAQGPPPPSFGGGPYGPAKPMPPPGHYNSRPMPPPASSLNSFGPPRKVGYESSYKPAYKPSGPGPLYNGPYLEHPPPSAIDGSAAATFSKPPPGSIVYGSKPPGPIYTGNNDLPPYSFENPANSVDKIQEAASSNFYSHQSSASASASSSKVVVAQQAAGLQQHVHHHYHHVEGAADASKVPTVPIPIGSGQTINTDFSSLAQSSASYTPQIPSPAYAAGFNGASQGGLLSQTSSGFKPNGDLYKPTAGFAGASSGFGQTGFAEGGVSNSYHSQNPDYYKKELHSYSGLSGASSSYNGISGGYNSQFNGAYDPSRQQIIDCQCVPFKQCPAADRIGRKEDLILAIDPRNLGKEIEALSDEAVNSTVKATSEDNNKNKVDEPKNDQEKKRNRREAATAEDKKYDDDSDLSVDAQGVSLKYCRY